MQASGEALVKMLNEAAARIRASAPAAPALPTSSARFATEPVVHGHGTARGRAPYCTAPPLIAAALPARR
jgi:hypothetical protein